MLRVALLQVTQAAHELLAGDVFVVGEEVLLGGLASVVDEDVGVGGHACDGTDHVVVEDVDLLGGGVLVQQLGGHLALGGQDDAVGGQDADDGACLGDGLQRILDLVESALGREGDDLGVVSARHLVVGLPPGFLVVSLRVVSWWSPGGEYPSG